MKIRTLIPFDRLKGNTHIPAALPQHLELIDHLVKTFDLHPDVSDKFIRCVINAIWLAGYSQGQRTPVFSVEKYTDEEDHMENLKRAKVELQIEGGARKLGVKKAVAFIKKGNDRFTPIKKNEAVRLVREVSPEPKRGGRRKGAGRKPGLNSQRREAMKSKRS